MKAWILAAWLVAAPPHVAVKVAKQVKAHEIEVIVHVAPDKAHRVLDVVVAGEWTSSVSSRQLGDEEERTQWRMTFVNLPAGEYAVSAWVDQKEHAEVHVFVY